MDEKVEALSNLIDKIVKKEILLPDFQRKFIWKEEEKQGRLIASVLAKMPIGSILLLDSDAKDYAYKMLGCRERKTYKELEMDGKILALLDGQQRVTVLTNAFSNVIFDMAKKSSNLINRTGLQRRFFLRIPKYERMEGEVEDFFQVRKLQFPLEDAEKEEPKFLSDDIYEAIKIISFNANSDECYNPFKEKESTKSDLINYCTSGKEYLIPLFWLTGKNTMGLSTVLKRISENICLDIIEEYDSIENEKKSIFEKNIISDKVSEVMPNESFKEKLDAQASEWENNIRSYLVSCLNNIQLHQIIVDNSKRARAINIYENLNEGGVSLGTFELVMARFASESDENYYDKIEKYMKKKRKYPEAIYNEQLKNNENVRAKLTSEKYIATIDMGCIENKNGEPVKCGNGFESCDEKLFGKKVMMKQFLGNELYSVLKKYPKDRIEECHWYNITSDNVIGLMAMKYYQLCNRMDFHQLYSELSTYLEEIETKTPDDEWSSLYIVAEGLKNDEIKTVKLRIDLKNTMDITAYAAASMALVALERNDDIGIYWANDILSEDIMEDYRKKCTEKGIYCDWQFNEEYEL